MLKIRTKIESIRPLLQNRFPEETYSAAKPKTRVGSHPPDDPETKLYKSPEGEIYQPSEHIHRSMVKAAVNFKIGGRGRKTYKDIINSSVFIEPETIPHLIQEWIPDKRSVVIQRSRIMRIRPRFNKWALEFDILVTEEQLTAEAVKLILDYAGRHVGIGDYRPRYGLFIVTQFNFE